MRLFSRSEPQRADAAPGLLLGARQPGKPYSLTFEKSVVVDTIEYISHLGAYFMDSVLSAVDKHRIIKGKVDFSSDSRAASSLTVELLKDHPQWQVAQTHTYRIDGEKTAWRCTGYTTSIEETLTLDDVASQKRKGDVIKIEFLPGRFLKSCEVNTRTGKVKYQEQTSRFRSAKADGYIARIKDEFTQ